MTNAQLRALLKWAIRRISSDNARLRAQYLSTENRRRELPFMAVRLAKADQWLGKARKAVKTQKTARKAN